MADIFISYARADREKAERLAKALQAKGYSVWWDRHIEGGAEFAKEIEQNLKAAKAVIVAWSRHANDSRWVKDEAGIAAEAGKLIAITFDGVEPPIGFKQFHCIDFNADQFTTVFDDLIRSLDSRFSLSASEATVSGERSFVSSLMRTPQFVWKRPVFIVSGIAGAIAILALTVGITRNPPIISDQASYTQRIDTTERASIYDSIAVLAFTDLSPDNDQEYFSDGISEELLNVLARQTNLRVAARTSSFAFKGKDENIASIGAALNVDAVLEGSVRKSGDMVRITAQLIDARSGFHLWSDTFDRKFDDVFAIQDEIAGAIVAALPSGDTANDLAATSKTDNAAYDLFLQGRHYLLQRTRTSIEKALELFQQAVEIDPDYAPAWAEIGVAANLLGRGPNTYGDWTFQQVTEVAAPAIEKSLSLNPNLAEAHTANGLLLAGNGKQENAISEYRKAIELNPSTRNARHLLYLTLTSVGRFREAHEVIDEAAEFDPLSAIILENQVSSLVSRGHTDQALKVSRRLLELHPGWPLSLSALAASYTATGQFAEAAKLIEESANLSQSDNAYASAAFSLINIRMWDHPLVEKAPVDPASFLAVNEGRHDEARALVMRQFNDYPSNTFSAWRAGWTLWAIGEPIEAMELFERSLDPSENSRAIDVVSPLGCYPGIYIAGLRQRFGDPAEASSIINECDEVVANMESQGYVLPFYERDMPIELMMLEGRHEEALSALRDLTDSGEFISWWIEVEPIYEPVRNDPRFKKIVSDLKLFAERERERYLSLDDIPQ